jgi:hypothetical protein
MSMKSKRFKTWLQEAKEHLDPLRWSWLTYMGIGVVMLAINLLGPKGLVHWVLLVQEETRLKLDNSLSREKILQAKEDLNRFQQSAHLRARKLREDLGFLLPDELSVEILDEHRFTKSPGSSPKPNSGRQ